MAEAGREAAIQWTDLLFPRQAILRKSAMSALMGSEPTAPLFLFSLGDRLSMQSKILVRQDGCEPATDSQ